MTRYRCATCGIEHDLANLEPIFNFPDAYVEVPEPERKHRTIIGQSDCRIRNTDDTERRFFLRTMMPMPVHGEAKPCCWGIWVEVYHT